jgi:hypothetical protein
MKKLMAKKFFMVFMVLALTLAFVLPAMAAPPKFTYELKSITGGTADSEQDVDQNIGFNIKNIVLPEPNTTGGSADVNLNFIDHDFNDKMLKIHANNAKADITRFSDTVLDPYGITGFLDFTIDATVEWGDDIFEDQTVHIGVKDDPAGDIYSIYWFEDGRYYSISTGNIQAHYAKKKI